MGRLTRSSQFVEEEEKISHLPWADCCLSDSQTSSPGETHLSHRPGLSEFGKRDVVVMFSVLCFFEKQLRGSRRRKDRRLEKFLVTSQEFNEQLRPDKSKEDFQGDVPLTDDVIIRSEGATRKT
ncbi:hypothetical protein RUM43_013518 [Polyplax serrata]|uniref:Uncharacterized protein n=1 Tax=Polyplax serrata TaxID=468196 RepID=A0AAN8PJ79_POLSC